MHAEAGTKDMDIDTSYGLIAVQDLHGWLPRQMRMIEAGPYGWIEISGKTGAMLGILPTLRPKRGGKTYPMSRDLAAAVAAGEDPAISIDADIAWLSSDASDPRRVVDEIARDVFSRCGAHCRATRRMSDMLGTVIHAGLSGSPAVIFTKKGAVVWSDHQGLASDERSLAGQIEKRLGLPGYRRDMDSEARERLTGDSWRLAEIGEALFGRDWQAPLSVLTGIDLRTIQRWAAASQPMHFRWLQDAAVLEAIDKALARQKAITGALLWAKKDGEKGALAPRSGHMKMRRPWGGG